MIKCSKCIYNEEGCLWDIAILCREAQDRGITLTIWHDGESGGMQLYELRSLLKKEKANLTRKTYKDDFFEKFPDAKRDSNGYPMSSVYYYYKIKNCCKDIKHEEAWDKPLGYYAQDSMEELVI